MNSQTTPPAHGGSSRSAALAHSTPRAKEDRVMIALSQVEMGLFFPERVLEDLLGLDCCFVDLNNLSSSDWEAQLEAFRPTILITGWEAPPLPDYGDESSKSLSVRSVCHVAGSVRFFIPRILIERGLLVSNWGNLAGRPVAEHALLLALSALRNVSNWRPYMASDAWGHGSNPVATLNTRSLFGLSVGLHGFGNVARNLVNLLGPFGVKCFVYSEGVSRAYIQEFGCHFCESLAELARNSNVFFECEALTENSLLSVNTEILAGLPDRAVVVNVARGKLIDEAALIHEAKSGRIQVALDVYGQEPVLSDDPLLQLEDGVFSPHIAGPTNDWLPRCGQFALENIQRYMLGEPVQNVITLDVFDRAT